MEVLKYCLYGSVATIIIGLIIYIFILRNRIKKLNAQIEELKIEIENYKVKLVKQEKDSSLKITELETQIKYIKQGYNTSFESQAKLDKIENSDNVKDDINDIINDYNEKNN